VVSYKPIVRKGERMLVRERMREREDKMKCLVFLCAAFRNPDTTKSTVTLLKA